MGSPLDSTALKAQIESSLNSILEISENWLKKLQKRQFQIKLVGAVLTTLLVWVGIAACVVGYVLVEVPSRSGRLALLSFVRSHPFFDFSLLALVFFAGVAGGIASYLLIGRKREASLRELSNLIGEARRKENASESQGSRTVDLLALTEKIMALLPEVVRKRNQDSFLFGLLTFVLLAIPATPPVALLLGVIVWLYFRYEMNKGYDREISRFEEQRRLFEQRKQEFLQTL